MTTVAVITPNAASAFASYAVLCEFSKVIVVPSPERARDIDIPVDALFVDAGILNADRSGALVAKFGGQQVRWFVVLTETSHAVDTSTIQTESVRIFHGPLTPILVEECLIGLLDAAGGTNSANAFDENF